MATNEPFWLGVPKSNMWPSRDSFNLKMLLLREENLLLLLPTCVWEPPADRQAGELEQAQANSWEKGSFLLKLDNFKTDNFLCMLITLGKGKTLQKEQTVRDDNSVCHHSTGEQSAGSVMRSNGCIEALVSNFNFNRHLGSHNSKLNSINSDKGRSFHLSWPHPPSQKLSWKACLRKLS